MKTMIVVPTYKRPLLIERLLRCLGDCTFPPDVSIHVVENGPRAGAERICQEIPLGGRVRYFYSEPAAKSTALNLAIRESDADFIIFLDDDVTVPPGFISDYVAAAHRLGPGHFFGGPVVAEAETRCPTHLVPHMPFSAIGRCLADREVEIHPSHFDYFLGSNWAAFRSDLLAAGRFSEALGVTSEKRSPVAEETELQRRLIANSVRAVYLPTPTAHHFVPGECYTLAWVRLRHFRNGLTDWKLSGCPERTARRVFGVPRWRLREYVENRIRFTLGRLSGASLENRTAMQVRDAYLAGWLYGAWKDRKRRGGQV